MSAFLADANCSVPADAHYVVFIGSNDVADAVRGLPCDPTGWNSVQQMVGGALTSLSDNIVNLYLAGAGSPVPPMCGYPPGIPGFVDVVTGLQSPRCFPASRLQA